MIIFSQVEPMFKPVDHRQYWMMPSAGPSSMLMDDAIVERLRQEELIRQQQQRALQQHLQQNFIQFFGMPQFQPDEIEVQLDKENRQIVITGKHERKSGTEFETCQFTKRIGVPTNVNMEGMRCIVADNGLLQVEAPLNKPATQAIEKQQPVEREIPIEFVNQKPAASNAGDKPAISASTERVIPIEFVDPRPRTIPPQQQQPVLEQCIQAKQQPEVQAIAAKPKNVCPAAQPCQRKEVREIPITIVRRPMDQGIMCPCCRDGRFNCMERGHDASHSCKPKSVAAPAPKKEFVPKNASALPEPEVQIEDIGIDEK